MVLAGAGAIRGLKVVLPTLGSIGKADVDVGVRSIGREREREIFDISNCFRCKHSHAKMITPQ